ncbi:GntR family transcriptional regulator [Actinacidiphila yanglinensis]|uniref:GntR family transcriptional regulator n=1 Tax=Actinacidiphila yanglinensis TaxID=310779 RepID=A0A1H6E0T4_9ACTN|nr:GntR family transcriptional regulator [Actinacidiphila yanglinensis]SEG91210.1 GntR family transcriptional regulator [Actinacidiphila yanglinensis]
MRDDSGERARGPLYRSVAADLREAITAGDYGSGGRLPAESTLAERYGVSRGTVRQALAALRADGLVTSRRGTRRVVLGTTRVQSFAELVSFTTWARSVGEDPGGRVEQLERRAADARESEQLRLEPGAEVVVVLRVRTLSGRPVMVERSVYPVWVGELVARIPADAVSHTEPLQEQGVVFADADHTIDLVLADADDARLLGCRAGEALLRERRRSTDPVGAPVEWSEDRYLPGTVAFTVHNSIAASALSRRHRRPH